MIEMIETCELCKHIVNFPVAGYSECWRFPPQCICTHSEIKGAIYEKISVRPNVEDKETCGEWESV